jgi:HlyD family secretion protein
MPHESVAAAAAPPPRRAVAPPNHHRRTAIVGGLAVVVLAAGAFIWHARASDRQPAFRFELAKVGRGPIQAKVTATGTVNPIVTVQVGTQVSGTIEKLGADFNSAVTPGQMVAQIDARLFHAAVQQAQANLLAARASVHKARAQLGLDQRTAVRNRELAAQQLIAQASVDATDTAAEVDQALLEQAIAAEAQARAALDTATVDLAYTTIASPIAGTVITRNIDVGQTVAASFAAPTLFLIGQDLTKMEVDTSIAEADVGRLAPGMTATFSVDAYPARIFRGAIRQVRSSPQIVQNVVTYNAVIDVDNSDLALKPGMTANLEVVYADRADVLHVANAALRFRPPPQLVGKAPISVPPGKKIAWVMRADAPQPIEITTGVSDGTDTEILDGDIRAGDTVVIEANPTHQVSGAGRIL